MPQDIAIMASIEKAILDAKTKSQLAGIDYVFSTYANDIQFDASGKIVMFENKNKLVQSALKILLTELGQAAEDADYGSEIVTFLGNKMNQESYTELVASVQQAMKHYNELNGDNSEPREYIESIDSVDVSASSVDPRVLVLSMTLTNEAGETVSITVPTVR